MGKKGCVVPVGLYRRKVIWSLYSGGSLIERRSILKTVLHEINKAKKKTLRKNLNIKLYKWTFSELRSHSDKKKKRWRQRARDDACRRSRLISSVFVTRVLCDMLNSFIEKNRNNTWSPMGPKLVFFHPIHFKKLNWILFFFLHSNRP